MNNMTNANNTGASANAGSASTDPASNIPAGQSGNNGQGINYEAAYNELEQKLGTMGNELGEYRSFVQNITPLLEKLDANPELVRAIVDGKINQQLVKSVLDGTITPQDAQAVTQASAAVAAEVGKKFESMTSDQIEALVESKAKAIRQELEEKADLKAFEERTQAFIGSVPDFAEYADEIDQWLDSHDIADVEIAYWAVKGKLSDSQAHKAAAEAEAERQKEYMMNASGGSSNATYAPDGSNMIDRLVGGPANPLL